VVEPPGVAVVLMGGVTQVLNKRGGPFTAEDEQRLKAFTAQVSIALQNAKLFDDVQNMRNYSEAMLASMSNGVITVVGNEANLTQLTATNHSMVLEPSTTPATFTALVGTADGGKLIAGWRCGPAPATPILTKYLPSSCRGTYP